MRRVISAALCAATLMAVAAPANAATNGQVVAVELRSPNALSTFNADGSGFHRLWEAPGGARLSSPVWSPDGNSLAFVQDGRIEVLPAAGGTPADLGAGTDPGWTPDGTAVAFRRGRDLLAVPAAGGAERTLGRLPDDATDDLGWSPDGWIARSALGALRVDALDGAGEDVLSYNSAGRIDWSPDGSLIAYAAAGLYVHYIRVVTPDGDGDAVTDPPDYAVRDIDPSWAPDGERIVYLRTNVAGGDQLRVVDDSGADAQIPTPYGASWADPDWQPCVAGVTTSCVSVTPPPPAVSCTAPLFSVLSGRGTTMQLSCANHFITSLDVLSAPAHGTLSFQLGRYVSYTSAAGYTGTDSFVLKASGQGWVSAPVTVNVTVRAPREFSLAAPKLNVIGQPKLDRRGRVTLRAMCDIACSAELRVSIRLNTKRVLRGRVVKASAAAGQTVTLRLRRAKLPKHRRIVSARISGTVTGTVVPRSRNFTLSLIP